jgi:hypothetical protein
MSIIAFNLSLAQVTETKLLPSDPESIKSFGFSVAMDGTAMVIGCGDANYLGPKTGVALVFRNNNGDWVEDSILMPNDWTDAARFGWSVDVQDDYLFISSIHDGANGLWAGAVYVYKYDPINALWVQHQKLVPSDIDIGDEFGNSVSVSGDRLLVGARGDEGHLGAAYVFKKIGAEWVEEAKLIPVDYAGDEPYIGHSVCIDGDYAIIGAPYDETYGKDAGSAFIFHFDGNNWIQQQKLISSDVNTSDYFGLPVSISGDYAMVTALNSANQTIRSGAVYVFKRNGNQWTEQQKLFDGDANTGVAFGKGISVQEDYLVIGAPQDNQFAVNQGAVFVYENNGSSWVQLAKVHASDGMESDKLGWSVDMDNGRAIAGAVLQDAGGTNCGAVYIFEGFASAIPESPAPLNFSLYPVPARDIVNCKLSTVNCQWWQIEVVDLCGKLVMSSPLYRLGQGPGVGAETRNLELNVSHLPAGIYFIRMQAGKHVAVRKLIVK